MCFKFVFFHVFRPEAIRSAAPFAKTQAVPEPPPRPARPSARAMELGQAQAREILAIRRESRDRGTGQNETTRKIYGFAPCFHLPGQPTFWGFCLFLTHSHMGVDQWLWVKIDGIPFYFEVGTTHFRTEFSGDWDVHWGYGILTHSYIPQTAPSFGGFLLGTIIVLGVFQEMVIPGITDLLINPHIVSRYQEVDAQFDVLMPLAN